MMFLTPDFTLINSPAMPQLSGSLTASSRMRGLGDSFDVLRRQVRELRVGNSIYRLHTPALAVFYPAIYGNNGKMTVTPSSVSIVGTGAEFDEAYQNWAEQFHVRFQSLMAMRPWEMLPEQVEEWKGIERMVNVEAYRQETPYVVRQIGELTHRRPIPNSIRWEDGRSERVHLAQMPAEFAALHEGQRFEAEVLRDTATDKMIQTLVVRRLLPLRTGETEITFFDTLPTTNEANTVSWDEFE